MTTSDRAMPKSWARASRLTLFTGLFTFGHFVSLSGADCDGNGLDDVEDITAGAADCNANGLLDTCEVLTFVRFDEVEEISAPPNALHRIVTLEVVDVDRDGDRDILAGTSSMAISVLSNEGPAAFTLLGTFPLSDRTLSLIPVLSVRRGASRWWTRETCVSAISTATRISIWWSASSHPGRTRGGTTGSRCL